jgi:hypothetical protein
MYSRCSIDFDKQDAAGQGGSRDVMSHFGEVREMTVR